MHGVEFMNNDGIGTATGAITSAHATRFPGATDQWTVAALFSKTASGGETHQRVFSNASGGNGANGYECNATYSSANDHKIVALLGGSGSNVRSPVAAYVVDDVVAAFWHYDNDGNETIYKGVNQALAAQEATGAIRNGSGPTGNSALMIGRAAWGSSRDLNGAVYRVMIFNTLIGLTQMEWMSFTNFANYPVDPLVADWFPAPLDLDPGDTVTTGDVTRDFVSGSDLSTIHNAPVVVAGVGFLN